jgi:hypothetical protein
VREKLGLSPRDWIWIGTLIVGWVANYAAVSTRLGSVERTVERIDARMWEMRGSRASLLGVAPASCPADATQVHLTLSPEVRHGTHR